MSSNEEKELGNVNAVFADDTQPDYQQHSFTKPPIDPDSKDLKNTGESDEIEAGKENSSETDKNETEIKDFENIDAEFEDLEDEFKSEEGFLCQIEKLQNVLKDACNTHNVCLKRTLIFVFLLLYIAYFASAMLYSFGDEGSIRLLWISCLVVFGISISFFFEHFGEDLHKICNPLIEVIKPHSVKINIFILSCIFVAFIAMVVVDLTVYNTSPYNLVSIIGIICYVFICYITSIHPSRIKWRTVAWGFGLQALMAMVVLRWHGGYVVFRWIGDRLNDYFEYINVSSVFLFGPNYLDHYFVMKLLPTVVFVSSTVSVLFYIGFMQWFILKISKVMELTMNTTAGESVSAAGNIFLGQIETSIVIKPIIAKMTVSEIHAVMTGGFATIAGTVMAAFILFGVPANHLISASVMSAPAALAISKISYPETKKSKTQVKNIAKIMGKSTDNSIIEAASTGAISSISLMASIIVNLIAFISLLEFFNATLTWFGDRVGSPVPITFQFLCSYALWPCAFVMGVGMKDCRKVAELIGVKVFINEFVAFEHLSVMIKNKAVFENHILNNGSWASVNFGNDILLHNITGNVTTILSNGFINDRSVVIATYALCGFSNFTSIGIQIGTLSGMIPSRKSVFSRLALRCMLVANVACFITACIAGLFYNP